MGLFNKREDEVQDVESLTSLLSSKEEELVSAKAEIESLHSEVSLFATKAKISHKAEILGIDVENMDAFLEEHTDYEAQMDALFALKEESVAVNTKEFLESAPAIAGEGKAEDTLLTEGEEVDFVPKNQREALSYLKETMPDLNAKERAVEARNLFPKLWEK